MKNQLCVDIMNITRELYRSYAFLEIPKEEFQNLMKKVVKSYMSSKQARRSKTPEIFFKKCFEYELHVYMGNLATTEKIAKQYANQYIYGVWQIKAGNNNIQKIRNLSCFLSFMQYKPNSQFYINLIRENRLLTSVLKSVLNSTFIKQNQKYLQGTITWELLKVYCTIYDMSFEIRRESQSQRKLVSEDLSLYLNDIREIGGDLLTLEEEQKLGFRILKGDKNAEKELVERNLKLVVRMAKDYGETYLKFNDAIQEGNLALVEAASRFDVTQGYKFSTFATKYIDGYLKRSYEKTKCLFFLPADLRLKIKKYNLAKEKLWIEYGREPSIEELAQELGMSISMVESIQTALFRQQLISLDQPFGDSDCSQDPYELIASDTNEIDDMIESSNLKVDIEFVLENSGLTEQEKNVLIMSAEGQNGAEIGRKMGFSRAWVNQCLKKVKRKVTYSEVVNRLDDYICRDDSERDIQNLDIQKNQQNSSLKII